jgi:glutamate synthase domain-containing protein 2
MRVSDNAGIPVKLVLASIDQRLREEGVKIKFLY